MSVHDEHNTQDVSVSNIYIAGACVSILQGRVKLNMYGDREPTRKVYQYLCEFHGCLLFSLRQNLL